MSLLEVQNLKVYFPARPARGNRTPTHVKAVDDVSFSIAAGETLGLVGESGCGKTTLGRAIVRLLQPTSGRILFDGVDPGRAGRAGRHQQSRSVQMIFQDPYGSLNPRLTAADLIGEGLELHNLSDGPAARRQRITELLRAVGLDPACAGRYPHEFSGGQRQRIGIARALAVEPKLIVCDEPVSALDVSVQAQIINLLQDLQQEHGLAYLFIAHDLAVVEHISHRVMVMYLGKVVESATARELIQSPRHPYTQALLAAVPEWDQSSQHKRPVLPGDFPSPIHPPNGCAFHPRCPAAETPRCQTETPDLREVSPRHCAACHLASPLIPSVAD